MGVNVAVTVFAASMVTTQVSSVPEHPLPDHPAKALSASGAAVRVTVAPFM
jgi:hypothetical protein